MLVLPIARVVAIAIASEARGAVAIRTAVFAMLTIGALRVAVIAVPMLWRTPIALCGTGTILITAITVALVAPIIVAAPRRVDGGLLGGLPVIAPIIVSLEIAAALPVLIAIAIAA